MLRPFVVALRRLPDSELLGRLPRQGRELLSRVGHWRVVTLASRLCC